MNKKTLIRLLSLLFLTYSFHVCAKVLFITHSFSRPDFIEIQDRTFKVFLKDDYEYVVFNDASDPSMCKQIEKTCKKLAIKCMRVPQTIEHQYKSAGHRHMDGIRFALNTIGFDHNGIVVLIDSDMFLIKPFNAIDYCKDYDIVGLHQSRGANGTWGGQAVVTYMAPLLTFMNMNTLPNKKTISFDGGVINGADCDVGGHMYYYLTANPSVKIKYYPERHIEGMPKSYDELKALGYNETMIQFFLTLDKNFQIHVDYNAHKMQLHDEYFLHYHAGGSNWNGRSQDYHERKTRILNEFINKILA